MKSKNVTLSIEADLLQASRRYAKTRGTSLNRLIRDFLRKTAFGETSSAPEEEFFAALDAVHGDSKGKKMAAGRCIWPVRYL